MKTVLFVMILVVGTGLAQDPPGQPYASYWFPNELLSWSASTDEDAPYNRSGVELSTRTYGDTQCNIHATTDQGGVGVLSIMNPSTSNNPSQGGTGIDVYAFNYWQYVDHLTFWGGSSGEGLILAPNPGVIDAGHRNGVPVYGTIFLPPVAYGGQIQWVWDLVQKSGSAFPVADKLIEMTEYYGFDGWFINQETAGGNAQLAEDLRDFMLYIQDNSDLDIQWYDSMVETGGISWQNALNTNNDWFFQFEGNLVSNWMFLNFDWSATGLQNSATLATSLSRSPFELYAGIDVQSSGYNTGGIGWEGLFPEGGDHVTSVGFYCPNWTYSNASSHQAFYTRANRFWSGANRDPSNTDTTHPWKGLACYFAARTPITSFPFVTNFNTGQGYNYSIDGEILSDLEWHNRSQQDVLPTWRWIAESNGTALYPEMDWEHSYYGGNCLKVSGDLNASNETMLYLYKMDAEIASEDLLHFAWYAETAGQPSGMELAMSFAEDPDTYYYQTVDDASQAGWNLVIYNLGSFVGSRVAVGAINFTSATPINDYEAYIGRFGVVRGEADIPATPYSFYVDEFNQIDDTTGAIRLRWNHSTSEVYTYNIYRENSDGTRTFLWATPNNACFVPEVTRPLSETQTTILLEAVSPEFGFAPTASTIIVWETSGISQGQSAGSFFLNEPSSNPVVGTAAIAFSLPFTGEATLSVHDLSGRVVQVLNEGEMVQGGQTVQWNTELLPAGLYIYRLECSEGFISRKCMVL
ncbi:MAG: T9SS type A sorting domain-containing protein [Candidatus Sabulitectum sp.]|nr:T9SS type A sorting domain-containing protein [Candidatus Sabulitectum sp.]